MTGLIESLLSLVYPRVCGACGRALVGNERIMCLDCRLSLPVTGYEKSPRWNHLVEKLMDTHAPVENAVAYFFYHRDERHARLVHQAKYQGRPSIGRDLMREYATVLAANGFFDDIDAIVPVPLSVSRLLGRGYNQSARIAEGLASVASLPVVDMLTAVAHRSQTRLGADARRRNADGIYRVRKLTGPVPAHVLLVDDIITTGATMRACVAALTKACPGIRVSVAALASTRLI